MVSRHGNHHEGSKLSLLWRRAHSLLGKKGLRELAGQKWVFGGVVRDDLTSFFVEFVESRDRETLLGVIRRRIRPETTIMSDCWRAYEICQTFFENITMFTIGSTTKKTL